MHLANPLRELPREESSVDGLVARGHMMLVCWYVGRYFGLLDPVEDPGGIRHGGSGRGLLTSGLWYPATLRIAQHRVLTWRGE